VKGIPPVIASLPYLAVAALLFSCRSVPAEVYDVPAGANGGPAGMTEVQTAALFRELGLLCTGYGMHSDSVRDYRVGDVGVFGIFVRQAPQGSANFMSLVYSVERGGISITFRRASADTEPLEVASFRRDLNGLLASAVGTTNIRIHLETRSIPL
jgi:hypothetical protein